MVRGQVAAVALSAIVLSADVPIDPPTCCIVLTSAEATPESSRATPAVAVLMAWREDHAEAQAQDEQGRQHGADIAGRHGDLRQVGHPASAQQHAGRDQDARSEVDDERTGSS